MANVKMTEAELDAHVSAAVSAALDEIKTAHAAEIAALNELLAKAREQNATADYSAYAAHPDLIELMKKTDLRPGALPALCALQIWNGLPDAASISKAIPNTPKLGEKGGGVSSPKIITSALQKLEKALLSANTGVGVRVNSIRGAEGNSTVKRIRFTPMVELADEPETEGDTGADASAGE
jgi:hypothetical protein